MTNSDPSVSLPPPPPVRWVRLLAILAVLVAIPAGAIEYNKHQRFVAWSQERAGWLEQCDPKRRSVDASTTRTCQDELDRLMTIAKREGWTDAK